MTMQDGRDETVPDQPITAGGENGTVYRQDDAPPGVPADRVASESTIAPEPRRTIAEALATLSSTPEEFARLIEGKSAETLAQPATDGEWGVVEILPHLRDWEEVYLDWIQLLLAERVPRLVVVDDSLWAIEHDYANENVPSVLDQFSTLRHEVVSLLESLEDTAWEREALHPQMGRITLHQLVERMCDHDARHIEQARDALA